MADDARRPSRSGENSALPQHVELDFRLDGLRPTALQRFRPLKYGLSNSEDTKNYFADLLVYGGLRPYMACVI
jgi:hypothetical protein